MTYQYDVFLSYKKHVHWTDFLSELFMPKFELFLTEELGYSPKIFYDQNDIVPGDPWINRLEHGLAHSRVMVCLWTKPYFNSVWCSTELRVMERRRRSLATPDGPPAIILAVVLRDSEDLPRSLQNIQRFDLRDHANPFTAPKSLYDQNLAIEIERLTPYVAKAIRGAPDFKSEWENDARDGTLRRPYKREGQQRSLPSLRGTTP